MKNAQHQGEDLILSIFEAEEDAPTKLTADQWEAITAALKPVLSMVRKFESDRRKFGEDETEFDFGGAKWQKKPHSKSVAYKQAYELAMSMVEDEELFEAITKTVESDLTKPTFKILRVDK